MSSFSSVDKKSIESVNFEKYLSQPSSVRNADNSVNNLIKTGYLSHYKNGIKIGPLHSSNPKSPQDIRISSKELDDLLLFTRKTDAVKTKFLKEKIKKEVDDGSFLPTVLEKYTLKKKPDERDKKYLLNNAVFNTFYEKVFTNKYRQNSFNKAENKGKLSENQDSIAYTINDSFAWTNADSFRFNSKLNFPSGKSFYKSRDIQSSTKRKIASNTSFGTSKGEPASGLDAPSETIITLEMQDKTKKAGLRPFSCGKLTSKMEIQEAQAPSFSISKYPYPNKSKCSTIKIGDLLKSISKQGDSIDLRIPTAKTVMNPLDSLEN